jgi:hypothetical protein
VSTTVWRRREDALWRRSLDAVIVFPVGADDPVTVSGSGAVVWDLLAEPATLDDLVDALVEVYDADRATIATDVAALLAQLESLAALESRFGVT